MKVISLRERPDYMDKAIKYIQSVWASDSTMMVYEDCISNCIDAKQPLPQWYILLDSDRIIGCAGLITNDFISRMDLYPWLCALYIEEDMRGSALGKKLIDKVKWDAIDAGFDYLYLCTDLNKYYEKYGFKYIARGYHPWGEESKIYEIRL